MDYEKNPYAPPIDEPYRPALASSSDESLPYYPVSILKLVVLSVFSLGFYDFYWMFKQWQAIRDHHGTSVSPFWRAFFGVWFVYALFDDVRHRSLMAELRENVPSGMSAAAYIVFAILGRIGGRIDNDLLWLVSFFTIVPLIIMQGAMNRLVRHHDPNADMNERFTAWNIIVIVVGAALWALIILGTVTE
jgi:hypothetical protein